MQFNKIVSGVVMAAMLSGAAFAASAEGTSKGKAKTKAYGEVEFLKTFSGKSRKQVADALGQPAKKELSAKPSNAENMLGRPLDTSKPSNVEMWYYSNNVKYDATHTYKSTEITFVNDRCNNIAFFNNN